MRFQVFCSLSFIGLVTSAQAQTACSSINSSNDLLSCLNEAHPHVQKTAYGDEEARGLQKSATAFDNPVLEFESSEGKSLGETQGDSTITISQAIQLPGKIFSKHRLGRSSAQVARLSSELAQSDAKADNALKILRYRQILSELDVVKEALGTYEKVDRQFSSRPKLSPDQQVSFGIFKLAIGDYRHKIAGLLSEKKELEAFFRVIPEITLEVLQKTLPKKIEKWPDLDPSSLKVATKDTPQFKLADATLIKAQSAYDVAASNTWPDITVGLIAQNNVEGTLQYQSYGFMVALPLPLWNWNRGERLQTFAEKRRAEIEHRQASTELDLKRQSLLESYVEFVKTLKESPSVKEIDKRHRSTESLFYNGLISGALVVEAHRQILDFTQTQNELEYETLQALLTLYSFDSRVGDFRYE